MPIVLSHLACIPTLETPTTRLDHFNMTFSSINKIDSQDGLIFSDCKLFLDVENFSPSSYETMVRSKFPKSWKVYLLD